MFCQIMYIRKLLTQNAPRKIEASQAEVLHIYVDVDASFYNSGYSGLGGGLSTCQKRDSRFSALKLIEDHR